MGLSGDGLDPDRRGGASADANDRALLIALLAGSGTADVERRAEDLLEALHSIPAILAAPCESVDRIGGEGSGRVIEAARAIFHRTARAQIEDRPLLASASEVLAYLRVRIGHQHTEEAHILFLDAANRLLSDERAATGTVNRVMIFPREIVRRALEIGAAGLILAHNHPSGDAQPSAEDIRVTRQLADLCRTFDIIVHDHIIIARNGHASLRTLKHL